MSLWSVMDGHGEYGHLVASFVQSRLASCVESQVDLRTRPEVSLTAAVARLTEDLAHTDLNIAFSGTTCVFAFKLAHMLYVGNIGDSRCVVCRQAENGDLQAIGLSIDQKPDNPREKARILKAGGRVEPLPGPPGEGMNTRERLQCTRRAARHERTRLTLARSSCTGLRFRLRPTSCLARRS